MAFVAGGTAHAQETANSPFAWFDVLRGGTGFSSGMDMTSSSKSMFGTLDIAPFGPADQDGWRLRLYGSRATYSYDADRAYCLTAIDEERRHKDTRAPSLALMDICNRLESGANLSEGERARYAKLISPYGLSVSGNDIFYSESYDAVRYEASITPGYQFTAGAAIIKAWFGPGYEHLDTTPDDKNQSLDGTRWGVKGGLDAWMRLDEKAWVAADGTYFTGSERYSASLRLGYQALSWLTVGPQLSAFGDQDGDLQRAGGFLNIGAFGMETTVSGGWTGNFYDTASPYGTASIYKRF